MEMRKNRLPKNIKAKIITVVEISVTCSCCKQKTTWTDKNPNFADGRLRIFSGQVLRLAVHPVLELGVAVKAQHELC